MRRALGKGLEALFPESVSSPNAAPQTERTVPISEIRPNRRQPRQAISPEALADLAESIRQNGVIQPLILRRVDDGYELIAGERRWRAAREAGLDRVAAVVREASDAESFQLALIENVQREDLSPLEEAEAYRRMVEEFGLTQDQVASRVGKSRATVANVLRLLTLPAEVKDEIVGGKITMGHARALLAADGAGRQVALAGEIVDRGLSVRDVERLTSATSKKKRAKTGLDLHVRALEEELCGILGTRVRLLPRGRGGVMEIHYHSNDALNRLVDQLRRSDSQHSNVL
jgi:ParB family chromosome partitioning protein